MTQFDTAGFWGVAYFTNSSNPRAQRWYYVARLAKVDGTWWELSRFEGVSGRNRKAVREQALGAGLALLHGTFAPAAKPNAARAMAWSLDNGAEG